jgi:hypothetical protein
MHSISKVILSAHFAVLSQTCISEPMKETGIYVVCLKSSVNGTRKQTKQKVSNKLTLLAFKIIAILHNTLLATFIKLLETVSKGLFRYRSQNRCHTFLDCRHVCKMCAFHDALQAAKQKEVHPLYSPDLVPAVARSGELYFGVGEPR